MNLKLSQNKGKIVQQIVQCKYIKREGESCTLNNNCTYPSCKELLDKCNDYP